MNVPAYLPPRFRSFLRDFVGIEMEACSSPATCSSGIFSRSPRFLQNQVAPGALTGFEKVAVDDPKSSEWRSPWLASTLVVLRRPTSELLQRVRQRATLTAEQGHRVVVIIEGRPMEDDGSYEDMATSHRDGVVGRRVLRIPKQSLPDWRILERWQSVDGVVVGPADAERSATPRSGSFANLQPIHGFMYAHESDVDAFAAMRTGARATEALTQLALIVGGTCTSLGHDSGPERDVLWGAWGEERSASWLGLRRPDECDGAADDGGGDASWDVDPTSPYHAVAWQPIADGAGLRTPSGYTKEAVADFAERVIDGVVPVVLVEAMADVLSLRKGQKSAEAAAQVVAARTHSIAAAERLRAAAVAQWLHLVGVIGHDGADPRTLATCEACGDSAAQRWKVRPAAGAAAGAAAELCMRACSLASQRDSRAATHAAGNRDHRRQMAQAFTKSGVAACAACAGPAVAEVWAERRPVTANAAGPRFKFDAAILERRAILSGHTGMTRRPALRRVGATEGRGGLDDLVGQQLMLAPSAGASDEPYVVVGVSPCLGAGDQGQAEVAPAWYTALQLDMSRAPKHEKALFVQLEGEEARRLVADTHRDALDMLSRGRSTAAVANGGPPQLEPGMQVSVLYGFNEKTGVRYSAADFTTNDGRARHPDSARRWYTATVVAHDEGQAFHIVLAHGDDGTDKDRHDLLVLHPDEYVQKSSGTNAWMSWCVGRPWRGYKSFAQSEELDTVPRPARETTPVADRGRPSWAGSMLGAALTMGSATRRAPS